LKFFEYSNSTEFLVTPDVVEYDKKKWQSRCMISFLDVKPWKR
jgi:hypothetical protein